MEVLEVSPCCWDAWACVLVIFAVCKCPLEQVWHCSANTQGWVLRVTSSVAQMPPTQHPVAWESLCPALIQSLCSMQRAPVQPVLLFLAYLFSDRLSYFNTYPASSFLPSYSSSPHQIKVLAEFDRNRVSVFFHCQQATLFASLFPRVQTTVRVH